LHSGQRLNIQENGILIFRKKKTKPKINKKKEGKEIYLIASGTVEAAEKGAGGGGRAQVGFALLACVALRAAAGEETLTGVKAGAAVAAGPVVGAVVEVLVAEKPAPALVAQTLPRLVAGAVVAAWVLQTLVAPRPSPPLFAPGTQKTHNLAHLRDSVFI